MAVNPNIKKKADDIRNKVYGKEVRESLASGLEEMSSDVVENEGRQSVVEGRQDSVESQWQAVSDEMTDKDVISAPEIIAARDGEPNLKARLDKENHIVTSQLAQTGTTASSLGLIPNSIDEANNNYVKLVEALNSKVKVAIDSHYYIKGNDGVVNEEIDIIGVNGSLSILDNGTFISFSENISVHGVEFLNEYQQNTDYLFKNINNQPLEKVVFSNNTIKGAIRICEINRLDIENSEKINHIRIENNRTENTKSPLFYYNGLDFNFLYVYDNDIYDMDMQFALINNTQNPNSLTYIEGNNVYNEPDIWVDAPSLYLCFLLYRGRGYLSYKNNNVEGLKTRKGNASVYDAYLSADEVDYSNNLWRDNITVSATRGKNGLFKAKEGFSGEHLVRYCTNNVFEMSDRLIDSLSIEEKERCYVSSWDFVHTPTTLYYHNNIVNVYRIDNRESEDFIYLSVQNNDFHTRNGINRLINPDVMDASIYVLNNKMYSEHSDTTDILFREERLTGDIYKKEVVIENNQIRTFANYLIYAFKAEKLVLRNNDIEITPTLDRAGILYGSKIKNLISNGNTFTTSKGVTYRISSGEPSDTINISDNFDRKTAGYNASYATYFSFTGETKRVIVEHKFLTTSGVVEYNFEMTKGVDEGGEYLEYTNGSTKTKRYDDGSELVPVNKLNDNGGNIRVYIYNADGRFGFNVAILFGPSVGYEKITTL